MSSTIELAMRNSPLLRDGKTFVSGLEKILGIDGILIRAWWLGDAAVPSGMLRKLKLIAGPHGRTFILLWLKDHPEYKVVKWGL